MAELDAHIQSRRRPLDSSPGDSDLARRSGNSPGDSDAAGRNGDPAGRNERCPCGSGKKYKHCHLNEDRQQDHSWTHNLSLRAHERLEEFGRSFLDEHYIPALSAWSGRDDPFEEEMKWPDELRFFEWFLHDYETDQGTIISQFLGRERGLSPLARKGLEAWARAPMGAWQVLEVRPEEGVRVRNVFSGEEVFVHDRSLSRAATRWAIVTMRVHPCGDRREPSSSGFGYSPATLRTLRPWVEAHFYVYRALHPGAGWDDFFHGHSLTLEEYARVCRQPPQISNTQGHALLGSTARYRVIDEPAARAGLRACRQFHRQGEGFFNWEDPKISFFGMDRPVRLGQLQLSEGGLVLETNSKERLVRGQELLARYLDGAIEHLGDTFQALSSDADEGEPIVGSPNGHGREVGWSAAGSSTSRVPSMDRDEAEGFSLPEPPLPPQAELDPQLEQRLLETWLTEYFEKSWLCLPIPALGRRSPSEAAQTARGRRQLEELFQEFEYLQERSRGENGAHFPIARLRELLALDEERDPSRLHPAWRRDAAPPSDGADGRTAVVVDSVAEFFAALSHEDEGRVRRLLRPDGRAAILVELYGPDILLALTGLHIGSTRETCHLVTLGERRVALELSILPSMPLRLDPVSTLVWERYRNRWLLEHILPVPLLDQDYELDSLTQVSWQGRALPEGELAERLEPVERVLATNMARTGNIYDIAHAVKMWRDLKRRKGDLGGLAGGWAAALHYVIGLLEDYDLSQKDLAGIYGVSTGTVQRRYREIAQRLQIRRFEPRYSLLRTGLEEELLPSHRDWTGTFNPLLLNRPGWL